MLRIRLRKCQGVVPGGETAAPLEVLTNCSIKPKPTGGTECREVRLLGSHSNSKQTSYMILERD